MPTLPVSPDGSKDARQMGASQNDQEPQPPHSPEQAEHPPARRPLAESAYVLVGKFASFLQFLADYNSGKCMREISKSHVASSTAPSTIHSTSFSSLRLRFLFPLLTPI